MPRSSKPVLRLIGDLRTRGVDWEMSEFGDLFNRLGTSIDGAGTLRRYLRYYGEIDGRIEVRFFGIEVEFIGRIPEGMVALELSRDNITVFNQGTAGTRIILQSNLIWNWLDDSVKAAPVGDFTVRVPVEWTSQPDRNPIHFRLTANSYSEQGKVANDNVRLVDYDPAWPARYDEMADWLRKNISPEIILRLEHYGSTAIPDMPAKPVIDILMKIPSFAEAGQKLIPFFNKPECEYWWYDDHMVFIIRRELMGTRTHHIHSAPGEHRIWEGIAFRDYLRTHPDDAARYASLKQELAECHTEDREAYTNSKSDFVQEITIKALRVQADS